MISVQLYLETESNTTDHSDDPYVHVCVGVYVCCNALGETRSYCLVQFVSDGVRMQEEKQMEQLTLNFNLVGCLQSNPKHSASVWMLLCAVGL